jgi:hypothetical protein
MTSFHPQTADQATDVPCPDYANFEQLVACGLGCDRGWCCSCQEESRAKLQEIAAIEIDNQTGHF